MSAKIRSRKSGPARRWSLTAVGSLLLCTIVLVGALTYVPALALGPIVEHFAMTAGTLFSSN